MEMPRSSANPLLITMNLFACKNPVCIHYHEKNYSNTGNWELYVGRSVFIFIAWAVNRVLGSSHCYSVGSSVLFNVL